MEEFARSFNNADTLFITDIYAASEDPIPGVTIEALAEAVRRGSGRTVRIAKPLDQVIPELMKIVKPGDAVITLGAGSIGTLASRLVEALANGKATT